VKIKLYGTRGSIAAPLRNSAYSEKLHAVLKLALGKQFQTEDDIQNFYQSLPEHLKYTAGGDTTCISVTSSDGKVFMVDCGTGGRVMGDELMVTDLGKGKGELELFFTHTHWDHIQGLPFFKPVYIPGNKINFYSPYSDLEDRLIKQQVKEFFPMPFHGTASTKSFRTIKRGEPIQFGNMTIDFYPLKHPGGSYAYKFTENGKSFIFATDAEFTGDDMDLIKSMGSFFNDADMLVLDSQYTLDESFAKFDWGHTSYTMAVNCANNWNIKTLVLTHHEPAYNDEKVFDIFEEAKLHKSYMNGNPAEIVLAREGLVLEI
jgi:phosphoribosyl 1,2-cyclic phosphodiesterase